MNLIKQKSDIFNRIKLFTSLRDAPETDQPLELGRQNNDPIDFMVSLLLTLSGVEKLRDTFTKVSLFSLPKVDEVIRNALMNQSFYPGAENLIMDFSITVKIKHLDPYQQYRQPPVHGTSFDNGMYSAINDGGPLSFNGVTITNLDGESILVENAMAGEVLDKFNDRFFPALIVQLIKPKSLIDRVLNYLFGHRDQQNQNSFVIEESLVLEQSLDKLLRDEDQPFLLTPSQRQQVRDEAMKRASGGWELDLICGKSKGTPNETLLEASADAYDSGSEAAMNNALENVFKDTISGQPLLEGQPTAAKERFFRRLIHALVKMVLAQAVSSPQARLYMLIISNMKGQNTQLVDSLSLLKQNQGLVKCILRAVMEAMAEAILEVVEEEAKKVVVPAFRKIVRQMTSKKIEQLRSLL